MKAIEHYSPVVLFITCMLHKVVLTVEGNGNDNGQPSMPGKND